MAKGVTTQFEECLQKGRIISFPDASRLCRREIEIANKDFKAAQEGLNSEQWKWSTIQAYYSMFHAARALLYSAGYREKSHRCLIIAVGALFIKTGKIPERFVDAFYAAKEMRENADYEEEFSEVGARKLVAVAKDFIDVAKQILI